MSPTLAQTRFLMAVCLCLAGLPDEARVCERFAAGTETASDRARWQQMIMLNRCGELPTGGDGMLAAGLNEDLREIEMLISFAELVSAFPFARLFPELSAVGCEAVRDIVGNPFRPVAFDPGWRTETAVGIARRIADAREYGNLPVLADALQDAGCDAAAVLDHCRDPGDHVPGCWVAEAVLRGNEPRQFILPRPPGSG